jgi:N-acetyl-anhydromuramyl-L-alanine amidase AmpD
MRIVPYASPNFNTRPCPIDAVLLHATADDDTEASVHWCCTPKPANPNPVSYHVIVDRDGTVYTLVDVSKRAWHAGVSSFLGRGNVNDYSIGVSFANKNDGREPYPEVQLAVGAALVASYLKRFPAITIDRVTTHAVVALPPGRKTDPRPPAFDLAAFKLRVLRELTPTPAVAA